MSARAREEEPITASDRSFDTSGPAPATGPGTGSEPQPAAADQRSPAQRLVAKLVGAAFVVVVLAVGVFGVASLLRLLQDADRALEQQQAKATESDGGKEVPETDVPRNSQPGDVVDQADEVVDEAISVAVHPTGSAENGPISVGVPRSGDADAAALPGALVWSLMAVPDGEALAVLAEPGADAHTVGQLTVPSRGLHVTNEVDWLDGEMWRKVKLDTGRQGWVPGRHLTAQPRDWDVDTHGDLLLDETRRLWAMLSGTNRRAVDYPAADPLGQRDDAPAPASESAARAVTPPRLAATGVWFGGIGVMGDIPTPMVHLDAGPLRNTNGWLDRHDFSPDPVTAEFCGGACLASPIRFLDLPEWDRPGVRLIIDDLDRATSKTHGHISPMQAMHSVTIDVPATNSAGLDWQRIHVFFDFAEGQPKIVGLYTWGWVP